MRSMLLMATLAFACGGEQSSKPPGPAPVTPAPAQPDERTMDAGAVAPVAQEPAADGDCVEKCVASRQMQATSVEQIEADCQQRCSGDGDALDAE